VLTAIPEIKRIKVEPNMDWMLVACDGIFDAVSTSELIEFSWEKIEEKIDEDVHSMGGRLINDV
jgi:serine/threonine protein phosphatase PrpC